VTIAAALATPALFVGVPCPPAAAQGTPQDVIGGTQLASKGIVSNPAAGVPALPSNDASSWVIADADTGQVLAAKDPHGEYLPASSLKTLTSITLIPKLDPNAQVRPTQETCDVTGTKVGMETKTTYTVADLFHGMLMVSGNDAALGITQAAGGYKTTVDEMNAEAKDLQADDTLAGSPNGLDVDLGLNLQTQHTSSYDLALFMRRGLALPDFRKYIGTVNYHWPAAPTAEQQKKHESGGYPIYSHIRLLPGESQAYPGFIGGKNGYTVHAEQTFVGAAQRGGHTIIVALMHSPSLWNVARSLFDWGFAADGKVQPVGTLVPSLSDIRKAQATRNPDGSSRTTAAAKASSGDTMMLAAIAGVVVVAGLGGGGFFLARRRRPATAGVGGTSGPGGTPGRASGGTPGGISGDTPGHASPGAPSIWGHPEEDSGGDPFRGVHGQYDFPGGGPRGGEEDEPGGQVDPYQ
jgi:D-alanyl-D-alanine carboxypeptidase (penicillin-binding protein 5/6)